MRFRIPNLFDELGIFLSQKHNYLLYFFASFLKLLGFFRNNVRDIINMGVVYEKNHYAY